MAKTENWQKKDDVFKAYERAIKELGGCRTPGSQKYDHRKSDVLSGSKVLHHLRSRYQKHIAYV